MAGMEEAQQVGENDDARYWDKTAGD
jgi:hypothetical protein